MKNYLLCSKKTLSIFLFILIVLSIALSTIGYITNAEESDILNVNCFVDNNDELNLQCKNIKNWKSANADKSLFDEINLIMTQQNTDAKIIEYVSNYFIDTRYKDEYLNSLEININFGCNPCNNEIATYATSNDVILSRSIDKVAEKDGNGYATYRCYFEVSWKKSPINRFDDIVAVGFTSDNTVLFGAYDGDPYYKSCFGQFVYDIDNDYMFETDMSSGGAYTILEYNTGSLSGCLVDLVGDCVLGNLTFKRIEIDYFLTIRAKSDFNMYGYYEHTILAVTPSLSGILPGVSAGFGCDLYSSPMISQTVR